MASRIGPQTVQNTNPCVVLRGNSNPTHACHKTIGYRATMTNVNAIPDTPAFTKILRTDRNQKMQRCLSEF